MFRYIARHWRGEFSLPQSYWVNGVLIGLPLNLYFQVIGAEFEADLVQSPTRFIEAVLLPFFAFVLLYVWQAVGIWRSAGHRIAEGKSGWSWVARIVVLINGFAVASNLVAFLSLSNVLVQAMREERAATFTVTPHGSYVQFHGEITDESARELEAALANPQVKRLVLNGSNGGFVQPSLRLAKLIKDRDLMVVAIGDCDSMCTMLLAAGAERAVGPDTVMGFHRATIIGSTETADGWEAAEEYYRGAGLDDEFMAKIDSHGGPADIWEPTLREMIDAGLITQVFDYTRNLYIPAREWCDQKPAVCGRTGRQNRTMAVPTKERS
jgi:hypothetical protein